MGAITFDTLAYTKKLKAVGFTEEQAEAQAEALSEIIDSNLATKHDIENIRKDIALLKNELVLKLGAMLAISIGVIATLVKIL